MRIANNNNENDSDFYEQEDFLFVIEMSIDWIFGSFER